MKKNIKIIVAVVILFLVSFPSAFGTISFLSKGINVNEQVRFKAINIDETTIKITLNPGEIELSDINTEKGMFATLKIPNFAFTLNKGQAKLPVIRRMIEIPQKSNPEILVKSISWEYNSLKDLGLPHRIIPAQMSVEKIPDVSNDFFLDEEYYSTNKFFPDVIVKIADIGEMRSRCFALIEISPLQYKPTTGELKIMKTCEIILNLLNSDMTKTYENIQRYSTPSFEKIFESVFSNYGFYENRLLNRNQEGYLIIVYDNFYNEIQPLVNMKIARGFNTTVTKTSQIPGGSTIENIYTYIDDAYHNWNNPPAYILLVGDTPQIPTYTGTTGPSAADLYYVTVDGSDYIPDIFIGRFPGSQESHIEAMVEKTVYYEEGSFPSDDWIKKAAFLASTDNWQISEGTHNYVIDKYLIPNGYTYDKLYTFSYGATTQQVYDAINDGRSLVIYSGHGSPSGWGDGPPFYQSDVKALTNENMYPFVCSHACSTNTFDQSECFGETWLREADKAAVAFWGSSASTYWDEDDILEKGMFQAWWQDDLEWIGGMTDAGLLYLYENYSGGGYTKYYFEAYNVNGDPSVKIWSDNPSLPPETPTKPDGPEEWIQNIETKFKSTTTDPEGEQIYYLFDWGDDNFSEWIGPYASGVTVEASHSWVDPGEYKVKVKAKDIHGVQSDWSEPLVISINENQPPANPTIEGPPWGLGGKKYDFTFVSIDPEGYNIYCKIDWDDGSNTGWIGPYNSGEVITLNHSWKKKGEYLIKAWAKDIYDGESGQGNLRIKILTNGKNLQKNQGYRNLLFIKILEKLMNYFITL